MTKKHALVPNYYLSFKCIGSECEASCCAAGWRIDVDKKTFDFYKKNQHPLLTHLFQKSVKRNTASTSKDRYGILSMSPEGHCNFLDEEKLCSIQRVLGASALCATCATYPRTANRFGAQMEYSLQLSCPEAVRLALLNSEPIRFSNVPSDPVISQSGPILRQIPETNEGDPQKIAILNDLRALVIGILQHRELSIDARLMVLGLLTETATTTLGKNFAQIDKLPSVIENFTGMLSHSASIQDEFDRIQPNPTLKLSIFSAAMNSPAALSLGANQRFRECLSEAMEGLLRDSGKPDSEQALIERYTHAYQRYFYPFFTENTHILENYLVHSVFQSLFPYRNSDLLLQFRELICNYLLARIFLTCMAMFHQKIDNEMVVRFFQSFSLLTAHNQDYLRTILKALEDKNLTQFQHLLLLIREN